MRTVRVRRGWRRYFVRGAQAAGVLLLAAVVVALIEGCASFGGRAKGPRLQRMQQSPQWQDGHFANPQPLVNHWRDMMSGILSRSPHGRAEAMPAVTADNKRFAASPTSGLRVTWLGHSSTLVEIDGHRVLTDPVWSERASPLRFLGPQRWYPPPLPLDQLPALDAVVVSHDHYDHLDYRTITALAQRTQAVFVVPLGLGAHLARWDVPATRIVELDWWQRTRVRELDIVCTPARHASGRMLVDNDAKLWAGYALLGPGHRVYFSGDTGLFPAMRDIGAKLGPFDLTMIEVGEYNRAWPDWHIGPEQAVAAHQLVRGRTMLPIHWGLFTLAYHSWVEPIERAVAAAQQAGIKLVAPRPGQSIEPDTAPAFAAADRWWPQLPWQTAAQHPIVSTQMNEAKP